MSMVSDPMDSLALSRRQLLMTAGLLVVTPAQAFAQAARKGGTLKIAAPHNPSTLDPMTGRSGPDHAYLYALFDSLIEWDYVSLTPKPGLAESWTYADPKTLVLKLRSGVKFHDGAAFDAEAVKQNLEWGLADQRSAVKVDLASIASIEVRGPLEVALLLKVADTSLPLTLSDRAGMMRSPKAVAEKGQGHDRSPVGTGAYTFVSWADNDRVVLARNAAYWKAGEPGPDGIELKIISEPQTALRSVIAGENDFTYYVPPQQKVVADRARNIVTNVGPSLQVGMLYFNYGRGPLTDLKVRQAVNHAVDRATYIRATAAGLGEVADLALPKAHWAYAPELAGHYKYDPEKAKALLKEAGHPDGIELHLIAWNDQVSRQRTEVLLEMFRKANIRIKLSTGSGVDTAGQFFGKQEGDMHLSFWTGRPDPSLTYGLMFAEGSFFNAGRGATPGLAEALAEAKAGATIEARKASFVKVQRIVTEAALFCPIMFDVQLVVHAQKVSGYKPNLIGKPKFEGVSLGA